MLQLHVSKQISGRIYILRLCLRSYSNSTKAGFQKCFHLPVQSISLLPPNRSTEHKWQHFCLLEVEEISSNVIVGRTTTLQSYIKPVIGVVSELDSPLEEGSGHILTLSLWNAIMHG